jgi:hypothetical protein
MLITAVNDTGDKFFAGVVNTAEIASDYHREFSQKNRNVPNGILTAQGPVKVHIL